MREKDLGEHSVLRDAYLYAAPIVSDRESVEGDTSARPLSIVLIISSEQCSMLK